MKRATKYITTLLLSAVAGLSSCVTDAYQDQLSDDNTIVLTLKMSGTASTRAITAADEIAVDRVNVLALTENNTSKWVYDYMPTVVGKSLNNNTLTITAKVKGMPAKQQFVVLANCAKELAIAAPAKGEEIEEIEERLLCKTGSGEWPAYKNGEGDFVPFPMYARTIGYVINDNSKHVVGTYPMIRMVARIDVSLHSGVSNFTLSEAYLFNYKTAGYISYFKSGFNKSATVDAVAWPAVPADGDHEGLPILQTTAYLATGTNEITHAIYTYESDAITNPDDMTKKTAVVIGGYYKEQQASRLYSIMQDPKPQPTYYRIDLKTDDDSSTNISGGILRNHVYYIQVMDVTGPGYDTPEEAYKGGKRITATVTPWNAADQNVIFDEQYSLTVSQDTYDFGADGGQINIVATTNYNRTDRGFPKGILADEADIVYDPEVPEGSGWLKLSDVSNTNGSLQRTIGIVASDNYNGSERAAKVYIKAGNLKKAIHIAQKTSVKVIPEPTSNCYLLQPNGNGIFIPVSRANEHSVFRGIANLIGEKDDLVAELIWTDSPTCANIAEIEVFGVGNTGSIFVKPGSVEGNAMIAVKVNNVIKWSWHIWVTNATLSEMTLPISSGTILDRNLGAFANNPGELQKSFGLMYQWGRKDPFSGSAYATRNNTVEQSLYDKNGNPVTITKQQVSAAENLNNSILNPTTFYYSPSGYLDWVTSENKQIDNLWSRNSKKTVYDPCPYGWKVTIDRVWGNEDVEYNSLAAIQNEGWSGWNNGYSKSSRGGWFPATGSRKYASGELMNVCAAGYVWTGFKRGFFGVDLYYGIANSDTFYPFFLHPLSSTGKASGFPVRCVNE